MSGLRAYATKLPEMSEKVSSQFALDNDRIQAKMQKMGFSNVLNQSQSTRRLIGDQHRVAVPHVRLQSLPSGSSNASKRWQGHKSNAVSLGNANDIVKSEQRSVEETNDHPDPFDTDIDNLDSTATLSGIDQVQMLQARSLRDESISGVDQVCEQGYSHGQSFLSFRENSQHPERDTSKENDFMMTEDAYPINGTRNKSNDDGDLSEQEDFKNDGSMPHGLAQDSGDAEGNGLGSYKPLLSHNVGAKNILPSPTAQREPDEPTPVNAPNTETQPGIDSTIEVMHSVYGAQCLNPIHDSRTNTERGSVVGHIRLLEPDRSNEAQVPIKQSSKGHDQHQMTTRALGLRLPVPAVVSTSSAQINDEVYFRGGTDSLIIRQKEINASKSTIDKNNINLDYNPAQLKQMTYQQLNQEAFHRIPQASAIKSVQGVADPNLPELLQHIYDLSGGAELSSQRRKFFSDLRIDQHEQCGVLLAEKISAIQTEYKVVRQQKRKVAISFENEVAHRAKGVLAKQEVTNRNLGRLKRAGENVVRGQSV